MKLPHQLNTAFIVINGLKGQQVIIKLENLDAGFLDRLTPNASNAPRAPHYYI